MAATENGKLMCERFAHCLINRGECLGEEAEPKQVSTRNVGEKKKSGECCHRAARRGKKARQMFFRPPSSGRHAVTFPFRDSLISLNHLPCSA